MVVVGSIRQGRGTYYCINKWGKIYGQQVAPFFQTGFETLNVQSYAVNIVWLYPPPTFKTGNPLLLLPEVIKSLVNICDTRHLSAAPYCHWDTTPRHTLTNPPHYHNLFRTNFVLIHVYLRGLWNSRVCNFPKTFLSLFSKYLLWRPTDIDNPW